MHDVYSVQVTIITRHAQGALFLFSLSLFSSSGESESFAPTNLAKVHSHRGNSLVSQSDDRPYFIPSTTIDKQPARRRGKMGKKHQCWPDDDEFDNGCQKASLDNFPVSSPMKFNPSRRFCGRPTSPFQCHSDRKGNIMIAGQRRLCQPFPPLFCFE